MSPRRLATADHGHFSQCPPCGGPVCRSPKRDYSRPSAGGCGIPVTIGRAAQSPILPCTGRGLPCRRSHDLRGGLLPHLFTLTSRLPARRFVLCGTFRQRALTRAAWTWSLRTAASVLPCGVRTFLSDDDLKRGAAFDRALGCKERRSDHSPRDQHGPPCARACAAQPPSLPSAAALA